MKKYEKDIILSCCHECPSCYRVLWQYKCGEQEGKHIQSDDLRTFPSFCPLKDVEE